MNFYCTRKVMLLTLTTPCYSQVNLYLLSRILLALVNLAVKKNIIRSMNMFPWFAALVWGFSLVLFEYEQSTVHPSLSASMTYIFHDCEHWTNLWDLFVYNTLLQ